MLLLLFGSFAHSLLSLLPSHPSSSSANEKQDAVKVVCFYWLKSNNIFNINESGKVELPESTLEYMRERDEKTKLLSDQDHHH